MLKPGTRLGNYEIDRVLGDGGMAIVYKARHIGMGTEHAVKVLLPNLAMNPKTVERFRQEASAQFRLRHPNIVQVTDYVETEEAIALVMDLVNGMTLRESMDQRPGAWPVADVVAVMRPVLDAVAYAHREGLDGAAVVHRDLKPENILLDLGHGRAWPGIPKVADFGIAKVMGTANVGTRTNARLGTVPYMSPEQFRSSKDVDARADVWALGMMLWHLVAGKLPLDAEDNIQLLQLYQGLLVIPALADVCQLQTRLSDVVAQSLSVNVEGRFADAWPLLRAVESTVPGAGVRRASIAMEAEPSVIPTRAVVAAEVPLPSPAPPAVAPVQEPVAQTPKQPVVVVAPPHDTATPRRAPDDASGRGQGKSAAPAAVRKAQRGAFNGATVWAAALGAGGLLCLAGFAMWPSDKPEPAVAAPDAGTPSTVAVATPAPQPAVPATAASPPAPPVSVESPAEAKRHADQAEVRALVEAGNAALASKDPVTALAKAQAALKLRDDYEAVVLKAQAQRAVDAAIAEAKKAAAAAQASSVTTQNQRDSAPRAVPSAVKHVETRKVGPGAGGRHALDD